MRYHSSDVCALMAGSQSLWKPTQYFIGNHTIAQGAFREDASAVLRTPLPSLIYADPDGNTKVVVDQPSLLFDGYGHPKICFGGPRARRAPRTSDHCPRGDVPPQL
jgi:hypothetical protein